jgi:D-alanyl-D-alanine carboxypeptidase
MSIGRTSHVSLHRRSRFLVTALAVAVLCAIDATSAAAQTDLRGALQARLDSLVASSGIPGITVGVVLPDGAHFGLAAGVSDRASGAPMRPDDRMLQGSVGKTYFGAVALQLVSEGRLDLDARLADYLGEEPWYPRLPNGSEATIRQLMSHTSGVVRYEFNPRFLEDLLADPMRTFTPEERLSYLFDSDPPFPAGEGWEYSDTNFILLAMVIEKITERDAYDEIGDRLLEPLGLDDTVPSRSPVVEGLVQGYGGGAANPFGGFDEMLVEGRLVINPQFEWGGGGFASTSEDLARWIHAIHEGRAFDDSLLDEARSGVPAPLGPQGSYGLGVIMMELPVGAAWGHSGFMPGYRTEGYYFPPEGFSVALQINTSDPGALEASPLAILNDLATIVARHVAAPGDF